MSLRHPSPRLVSWAAALSIAALPAGARARQQQTPQPKTWTAEQDHQNMMDQLGITALRPGPSGDPKAPNHANYDEALANPYPDLPDPLVLKDGRRVTTPEMWWQQRRPEIVEDFEREVVGRIPEHVPGVTWTAAETRAARVAGRPVTGRHLVGHVDNSSYPLIDVNVDVMLVTPDDPPGPVPVMIIFRGGTLGQALGTEPFRFPRGFKPSPAMFGTDPPASEQLIADGWGYAYLNPNSVQADNGAGLTRGIIGLVNKGQPRTPDDWGSLRAWAWGASRLLDYFESTPAIDAKRVGIDGVSRYGKAALVTMAFDQRFAVVLVGSSGEGGAKLHRRNFGEAVENLTGTGEYHWMAGNFLKYGASEARFGSRTAKDLPVDAHELIALCAPRPTFISYGVPEQGDAHWLDHQGSFMAAVAAGPVFRLLGAKDLGVTEDYHTAKMPPVNVGLLEGQLAWRQHDAGHTDGPNWKYFIPWADRLLGHQPWRLESLRDVPADVPVPRLDLNSLTAHAQLMAKKAAGQIDLYFEGDSITRRWGATDYPQLLANWNENFHGWNAADFAWGGDTTQNILWRLQHGELDDVHPKVIVLQAGTNNVGRIPGGPGKADDIARGIKAIIDLCREKAPEATIVLTAVFPRNDNMAVMPEIDRINAAIEKFADGRTVRWLNINDRLADAEGRLSDGMMNDDHLHPSLKGYEVWGAALKPVLTELLGPPAAEDHAPPPTRDPSASSR